MMKMDSKRSKKRKNKKGRTVDVIAESGAETIFASDRVDNSNKKTDKNWLEEANMVVSTSDVLSNHCIESDQCLLCRQECGHQDNVHILEQSTKEHTPENESVAEAASQVFTEKATDFSTTRTEDITEDLSICHCETCNERRAYEAEQAVEQQELRKCWLELKQAVHQMYRAAGLTLGETLASQQLVAASTSVKLPTVEHLKALVHRLCENDPHKLLRCLETQVQLFIVEMRLRLLRNLVTNTTSQLNKPFALTLLEEYTNLCSASEELSPILKELELVHLKRFNVTWELVNRHLFEAFVYSDPILRSGFPDLYSSSSRIGMGSHNCHSDTNSAIMKLNDEMLVIAYVWKEAEKLIMEFSQGQGTVKSKHVTQDWDFLNTHFKVLEEEFLKTSNVGYYRCPCDDCNIPKHPNLTDLTSHMSSSAELISVTERAESFPLSALPALSSCANHSTRDTISHRKSHCNVNCSSSVSSTHRDCSLSSGSVMKDKTHKLVTNHRTDSDCQQEHATAECASSNLVNSSCSSHKCTSRGNDHVLNCHHCFHSSVENINESLRYYENHPSSIHHSYQSLESSLTSPITNGSISSVLPNSNHSVVENGSSSTKLLLQKCGKEEKSDFLESLSDIQESVDTIEEKQCECHACIQPNDQLTLPGGPLVPTLPSNTPLRNNIPLFPPLGEISQSLNTAVQPLIHPHLYNMHMGKGATTSLPSTKPTFFPWPIDLDLETQEVLQEQIYLATCGEWDYNINDVRSLLIHKYSDLLGNNNVCIGSQTPHLNSPVNGGNANFTLTDKNKAHGSLPSEISALHGDKDLNSDLSLYKKTGLSKSVTSPSVIASNCLSNSFHHDRTKCSSKRYTIDSLCSIQNQTQHADACTLIKNNSFSPERTSSPTRKAHQTDAHILHNSSNMTAHSSDQSTTVSSQNGGHSASSSCCEDQEVDSNLLEDDSVDDSCSEQSSSTSSNQRESRVCDCCYCEVFGHGMPAVAPVSKNYPEMRERLRLRLSKRKAEGTIFAKAPDKSEPQVDNRAVEELLKFIIGPEDSTEVATATPKTSKRQKKKKKKSEFSKDISKEEADSLQHQREDKSSSCVINNCNDTNSQSNIVNIGKEESKMSLPLSNPSSENILNDSRFNSCTGACKKSAKNVSIDSSMSTKSISKHTCKSALIKSSEIVQSSTKNGKKDININIKNSNSSVLLENIDVTLETAKDIKTDNHMNHTKSVGSQVTLAHHDIKPSYSQKDQLRCKSIHTQIAAATATTSTATNVKNTNSLNVEKAKIFSSLLVEQGVNEVTQGSKLATKPKKSKKKKNGGDDSTSPDDVFMPKDIDLDDGDLDELERELEAFKRFCFNSVPLAQKEKVNVNLKEIISKKKSLYGSVPVSSQK